MSGFSRQRTLLENIKASNAILSRFDLVFLLLDDPDAQKDKKLSEHVMKLHSRQRKRKLDQFNPLICSFNANSESGSENNSASSYLQNSARRMKPNFDPDYDEGDVLRPQPLSQTDFANYASLQQRIKYQCDIISDQEILPPLLLKKFVSYARHTVFPKLSLDACEVIKDFYITLRENASANSANSLPITSRQLESLIRLSQARAKVEFRNLVTRDDALDVVRLVQESLFET